MTAMHTSFRSSASDLMRRPLVLALALVLVGLGCGGGSDDDNDPNPISPTGIQVLKVGDAEGAAGDTTTITFLLENTEPLSGLQFDLLHSGVLTVVEATSTARTSGFEVFHSAPAAGTARVLLTDLSGTAQLATGGGSVVTLRAVIDAGAPLGTSTISTADAVATDLSATSVSLGSSSATLTVR